MQHNYRLGNQDYTIYGISQLLISCSWSRTTSRSVRSAKRHSETYCFWPYLLHRYGVQTLNLCASVYVWLQWMWGGFGYQLHISIKSIATNVYLGNRKLTSRFRVQVNSKWSVLPPFWTNVCITSFFCDDTSVSSHLPRLLDGFYRVFPLGTLSVHLWFWHFVAMPSLGGRHA